MYRCLCISMALLLTLGNLANGQSGPVNRPSLANGRVCSPEPGTISDFDRFHPERFVSVYEVTRDSQYIPIHEALLDDTTQTRHERAHSRVDINSKLHMTFARRWIAQQPDYQTNVGVSADLNGEPIAVPAYSEVGTQATTGFVNASGLSAATAAVCSFVKRNESLGTLLFVRNAIRNAQNALPRAFADSVAQAATQVERLRAEGLSASDSIRAALTVAEANLQRLRSSQEYREVVRAYAPQATEKLVTALDAVYPSVLALSQADTSTLNVIARRAGIPTAQLTHLVQNVLRDKNTLDSLNTVRSADAAWLGQASSTIDRLQFELPLLTEFEESYIDFLDKLGTQRDPVLLEELRDTDLLISRTKAKPGDEILLTFTNTVPPGATNPRQMTVDLRIRRFGWVSDITDSFLFLRRLGVTYQEGVPNLVARAEQALAAGTDKRDSTLVVPLGVDFDLTPGASFIWTRYSRGWSSALAPSFGLNVSFPKFQTRTYQLSVAAGANRDVTRKEETTSHTFDLAVGPYIGFFDGAIGITAGRAITVERRPWYFGIGLSFLRLAKNASKVLPTAQ